MRGGPHDLYPMCNGPNEVGDTCSTAEDASASSPIFPLHLLKESDSCLNLRHSHFDNDEEISSFVPCSLHDTFNKIGSHIPIS